MSKFDVEHIVLDFGDNKPFRTTKVVQKNGWVLWVRPDGTILVDGLFKMHDEQGFPLFVSLSECKRRGLVPCLQQFKLDALKSGWPEEKADRVIAEAQADTQ